MKGNKLRLQTPSYHSYLLRVWRRGPTGDWLASLEDTATGRNQHFTGFEPLVDFLRGQAEGEAYHEPDEPERNEPATEHK